VCEMDGRDKCFGGAESDDKIRALRVRVTSNENC
jgi:hypothetical protein